MAFSSCNSMTHNIFGHRSNPDELRPKIHFSGIWPFEADLRQRRPFHAYFPTQWIFFWQFLDSNLFSMHRREYLPIFIWIGSSGECRLDMLLQAVANRVKIVTHCTVGWYFALVCGSSLGSAAQAILVQAVAVEFATPCCY